AQVRAVQLADACESQFGATPETRDRCLDVVAAVELLQPEAGILLAGANPVLGTASPLGTRGGLPRFAVGGRIHFVGAEVPDVFTSSTATGEPLHFFVPFPQADVAVGLYNGVSLLPGVRGFGALDAVVSASLIPAVEEIEETKVVWGLGGRFGLMEETFVLPGASIAVVYKDVERLQVGSLDEGDRAEFGADLRVLSVRAAASKTLLTLGVTGGVGWDRYRSDIDFRFDDPILPGTTRTVFSEEDPAPLESERWSAFIEMRWTLTVMSLVGQLGIQEHDARTLSDGATGVESGGLFGGIGLRLGL
ncbi:MAG: hypothetical protein ACREKI_05390, partial [Gemmatimonadota bacterium]